MALISCPECNQQISDRAKACPHCGFDMTAPKCAECGKYLPEDATTCPACGCPVETSVPAEEPAPVEERTHAEDREPAPVPRLEPDVTLLELPGPHPSMKKQEEWVLADAAGKKVLVNITWGKTRQIKVRMSEPKTMWLIPRNQLADKRLNWLWLDPLGVLVALLWIASLGLAIDGHAEDWIGFGVLTVLFLGFLVFRFLHRRSKHLRKLFVPGKRYNLVWKNRHTFSVSEYEK